MSAEGAIPDEVLDAWALLGARVAPITIGLINRTFDVQHGERRLVLQRLHPIFGADVCLDLEAVSEHVARRGVQAPRLVRTEDGRPSIEHDGGVWRALSWLDGRVVSALSGPLQARAAGELVARFHAALADLEWQFRFGRAGVHDTVAHLSRLAAAIDRAGEGRSVAEAILAHAAALPPIPGAPERAIHGDLKITNLMFDDALERGVAVLDLDTLARGSLAVELGDALRSWCNRAGESASDARIDVPIFEAAVVGYAEGGARALLSREEIEGLVPGVETISIELASRFALDAIEDRYFGWDASRYPSRVAHNRARAEAMLALARSVRHARAELEALVRRAFP